jgi:hypothetical protein
VRDMLAPRIKAGIERAMAGQLVGTRPVRLEIIVKSFVISSAVQRILIGGGRGMVADANLVDARTGALIVAYPDVRAVVAVGQGVVGTAVQAAIDGASTENPADKLVNSYGQIYRDWLVRKS